MPPSPETAALDSEHGPLPLPPIDRPRGLFLRALYRATRRRYGKTPTAFRVIYARAPWIAFVSMILVTVIDRCLSIDSELRFLLSLHVATGNGCTFCADLTLAEAARKRIGRARFAELRAFGSSAAFSPQEKAALAYAEALERSLHVGDDVFSRLRDEFTERQVVEIVWVCAAERYFNAMALPLRIGSDRLAGD